MCHVCYHLACDRAKLAEAYFPTWFQGLRGRREGVADLEGKLDMTRTLSVKSAEDRAVTEIRDRFRVFFFCLIYNKVKHRINTTTVIYRAVPSTGYLCSVSMCDGTGKEPVMYCPSVREEYGAVLYTWQRG